jgi:hypothetical protein
LSRFAHFDVWGSLITAKAGKGIIMGQMLNSASATCLSGRNWDYGADKSGGK